MTDWIDVRHRLPPNNMARGVKLSSGEQALGAYHGGGVWHIWDETKGREEWTDVRGTVAHWGKLPGEASSTIPELDIDQLDADLYEAWRAIIDQDYGAAETLVFKGWMRIREFLMSLDEPEPEDLLRKAVEKVTEKVDSTWELRGDPEQVERFRSILELSGAVTKWARVIILPDLEAWEGVHKTGRLRATTDRDLRALVTKALYAVLNRLERFPDVRRCHKDGLECEYVYPYGFVPEGECPRHDP